MSNGRVRILILSSYIVESRIITIIKETNKVLNITFNGGLINDLNWIKVMSGKTKKWYNDTREKGADITKSNYILSARSQYVISKVDKSKKNCSILFSIWIALTKELYFFKNS